MIYFMVFNLTISGFKEDLSVRNIMRGEFIVYFYFLQSSA